MAPSLRIALAQQSWSFADSPLGTLYDLCEYKRLPGPDEMPGPHPALLHLQYHMSGGEDSILNLGSGSFPAELGATALAEVLVRLRPAWISLHLGFSAERLVVLGQGQPTLAEGPPLSRSMTWRRLHDNVTHLRAQFPGTTVLLENLDYMPATVSGAYEHVCEPGFITDLTAATDCALLLDLAHARVSAGNLGIPWRDYLFSLPLDRVRQVHLSRPEQVVGGWMDSHLPITTADVETVVELLPALPRCEVLTLETFGPPEELAPQLALLQRFR